MSAKQRRILILAEGKFSPLRSKTATRNVSRRIDEETGLPAVDTFRFGAARLADALLETFAQERTPASAEKIGI